MQQQETVFDLRGLTLVAIAGAWLAGILLSSWLPLPSLALLIGAIAAFICIIPLWRDSVGRLIMLSILFLLLGAWRYAIASPIGDPQAISAFIGSSKLEVRGIVADEPKLEGRSRVLLVDVSSVSNNGGATWQDERGQMEVQMLGAEIEDPYGANYGDSVELEGKLHAPLPHSPPSVFADMTFPRIHVSSAGGNPIVTALYHLRTTLATIIAQSLPQPEAALLIAILLGLRTPALEPLIHAFNVTSTVHLIVPSGFKVTILAGLVATGSRWLYEKPGTQQKRLLPAQKRRRSWRPWLATGLVIASIGAYTILSGAGPPAIRAGVMGILLVVAPRLGRIYNIYTALAMTALLISIFDPFVLWDAGFQLSFLGTLGIVLLTPLFQRLFHPLERLPFGYYIAEIIAVTLAAQVATLPILALTFNQVSFIAPIANLLTVPLLGVLILLGLLLCGTGLLSAPLGILCGWAVWPILWYLSNIVPWCAALPGAYLSVSNLNSSLAWCYYGLLAFLVCAALRKWPVRKSSEQVHDVPPLVSQRTWRLVQLGAALLVMLATGATALAAQPDGRLTVTFLSVGPAGQPAQGEAILIRTPDGKTALIDGGLDASSLAEELDSRLPPWQRSLDVVILTSPRQDHLAGLQDIVNRYEIGEVLDAGMLHPNAGYALWRHTISQRNLHYAQVRRGTTVVIGTQVVLQVFWPPALLHKGSDEELDNALIVRLVAPGVRMLLLGASALSKYALTGLMANSDPSYLQADIVQVVGEVGKAFPSELSAVLQAAHPSLLVITPAALSAKLRKAGGISTLVSPPASASSEANWQIVQTAQTGTMEISSTESGWSIGAG